MNLDEWFRRFLQEKQFLDGFTPKSIQCYEASDKAFKKTGLQALPADLQPCVMTMREGKGRPSQLTPTANTYRKGSDSFFSWRVPYDYLNDYLNDYLTKFSKLQPFKTGRKIKPSYSDEDVRKIIAYRPQNYIQKRLHPLWVFAH